MDFHFQEKKDEEKPEAEKKPAAEAKPKKLLSHVKDYEEDTVYLFQFTRSPQVSSYIISKFEIYNSFRFQIPSISPFCLKLESWLKLHGIKYQVGLRTEHSLLPLTSCHPCLWSDEGLQHCSRRLAAVLQSGRVMQRPLQAAAGLLRAPEI